MDSLVDAYEKLAAEEAEEMYKLAEEEAAGRIMARGFWDELNKFAEERTAVMTGGRPAGAVMRRGSAEPRPATPASTNLPTINVRQSPTDKPPPSPFGSWGSWMGNMHRRLAAVDQRRAEANQAARYQQRSQPAPAPTAQDRRAQRWMHQGALEAVRRQRTPQGQAFPTGGTVTYDTPSSTGRPWTRPGNAPNMNVNYRRRR